MIAQIAGCLLILAGLSFIKFKSNYNRIFAYLLTFLFFMVFARLITGFSTQDFGIFTLLWNSSPAGDLKLEIISSPVVYQMIIPFFAISAIALFNNLFYSFELYKKEYVSVVILNLFCLVMLICSDHFIQMVTFVFLIDILSQFLIKDISAGRRYALYNLAADMGLFGVFAILNGQIESLNINAIRKYYSAEEYRDFIAILLMAVLFVKFGFFISGHYMRELKNMRFHRLILIPYLSSAASALILLVKLYPLLVVSPLFSYIFNMGLLVIIFYGSFGVLFEKTLKEKTIYLNMMQLALLVKLLESADFKWDIHFSWLIILSFMFNLAVYYLHYYTERTMRSAFSSKFKKVGHNLLLFMLFLWVVILGAFSVQAAALLRMGNLMWEILFLLLFSFVASDMFNRIVKNNIRGNEVAFDRAPFFTFALLLLASGWALLQQKENWPFAAIFCAVFCIWIILDPAKRLRRQSLNETKHKIITSDAQTETCFSKICRMVLTARLGLISGGNLVMQYVRLTGNVIISLFRKFDRMGILRYIFFVLLAALILFWIFQKDF